MGSWLSWVHLCQFLGDGVKILGRWLAENDREPASSSWLYIRITKGAFLKSRTPESREGAKAAVSDLSLGRDKPLDRPRSRYSDVIGQGGLENLHFPPAPSRGRRHPPTSTPPSATLASPTS